MLKTAAIIFGAVFVLVGVLGFIPAVAPDEHLFGVFHVNTLHNIVHLASGVAALVAAGMGERAARIYFQVFGVVYAIVAVAGMFYGEHPILGVMSNNLAITLLHVAIAGVALVLGFGVRSPRPAGAGA